MMLQWIIPLSSVIIPGMRRNFSVKRIIQFTVFVKQITENLRRLRRNYSMNDISKTDSGR